MIAIINNNKAHYWRTASITLAIIVRLGPSSSHDCLGSDLIHLRSLLIEFTFASVRPIWKCSPWINGPISHSQLPPPFYKTLVYCTRRQSSISYFAPRLSLWCECSSLITTTTFINSNSVRLEFWEERTNSIFRQEECSPITEIIWIWLT